MIPRSVPSLLAPLQLSRALSTTSHAAAPPPPPSSSSNLLSMSSNGRQQQQQHHQHQRPSRSRGAAAAATTNPPRPGETATNMLNRLTRSQHQKKLESVEALRNAKDSADYLRQMPRRWEAGDVYSPHDLSAVEMQKWRKRSLRKKDVVDVLGIRPLDMYKNFSLVQEFTTSSGQIIHSAGTRLRPVNQRKIAKMIRRVQGMGLYPTIHDHPELLRSDFFPERR